MTTEVLRNMLYADSPALRGLVPRGHGRGALPGGPVPRRRVGGGDPAPARGRATGRACRRPSATPRSSARGWRPCAATPPWSSTRCGPIPLWQHIMVGRRMFDLFDTTARSADAPRLVRRPRIWSVTSSSGRRCERGRLVGVAGQGARRSRRRVASDFRPLPRPEVIARLDEDGLLPAITFIFSRAGCDAAWRSACGPGCDLTTDGAGRRDPADHRRAHRRTAEGRPRGPRLLGVAQGARTRHRRAPRRDAARVPAHRRGTVRQGTGAGGVRHRDAGAGHQHARPHGRARTPRQVQRRDPRRTHPGGVHPAHRPGGTPRHRHRGARGGAVAARGRTRRRSPGWPPPAPSRCAARSGRPTTCRST